MRYLSEHPEARRSEEIVGDRNLAVKVTRASVPRIEVKHFFMRLKKELADKEIFDAGAIASLEGIGSSRQYLEEDFQKPYGGDLDVIIQLPVAQELLGAYINEQVKQKLDDLGIKYQQSFGNISLFIPVQQEVSEEELYIQVDIMLAPGDDKVFKFMKEVRYFSGEPYELISGKYYLKGVHTALLLENMLKTKGYLMNNLGIYREQYHSWDESTKAAVAQALTSKNNEIKKKTKKLTLHNEAINERLKNGFPLSGAWVTAENRRNILPEQQKLYEEIENCLIKKVYEEDFSSFLSDTFRWEGVRTFEEGLAMLTIKYREGFFSDEEIQSLFVDYAARLIDKNKGTLWFPELQQKIVALFPFVDFSEVDTLLTKKQEKQKVVLVGS